MSGPPFRFVHASDFHLDQPPGGVEQVPEHLRDLFLDAPYAAAQHVFQTAIHEQADFLVLAGDVVRLKSAGPRALDFLYGQFQQLAEQQVSVYWCDSSRDRLELWPSAVPLPAHVHLFADESVDVLTHRRDGEVLATILGCAGNQAGRIRPDEFDNAAAGYVIATTHGNVDADAMRDTKVNYWALGGRHQRETLFSEPAMAHYCGSPQGRGPSEEGPHGCALVDVDRRGRTVRQTMTTDVLRWYTELVDLPDHIDQHGLLRLLRDQCHRLAEDAAGRQVMVRWMLTDSDQLTDTRSDLLAARLRQGGLARDLLSSLRAEFGAEVPGVWPVEIDAEPPAVLPSGWYEEDTVLGDLLRLVQQRQQQEVCQVPLEPMEADPQVVKQLSEKLRIHNGHECQLLLREVAALGVDLLRGDRILSEEREAES